MSLTVLRADAAALPLADDSVDLVVTSPPYFALRSYTDAGEHLPGQVGDEESPGAFLDALIAATAECVRVLKPTGSLWVNLGDKYAERTGPERQPHADTDAYVKRPNYRRPRRAYGFRPKSLMGIPWRYAIRCIDDLGLILRAEVVWDKANGMPESVGDRVRRSHEQWFHFTRSPRYYADLDPIREPHAAVSIKRAAAHRADPGRRGAEVYKGMPAQTLRLAQMNHPLGKLPGSVWSVATEPLIVPDGVATRHYAAFPTEWPRRIISAWCPPGGVVLDPFGGTGTTAHVASALGRRGISADLSTDYCRLAAHPDLADRRRRKVLDLPRPAATSPDQGDLFGTTA